MEAQLVGDPQPPQKASPIIKRVSHRSQRTLAVFAMMARPSESAMLFFAHR
jgi:hypothetical protein